MVTLEKLEKHHEVLEQLLTSKCVCANVPTGGDDIIEAVTVANDMLSALIVQLKNQAISFTP